MWPAPRPCIHIGAIPGVGRGCQFKVEDALRATVRGFAQPGACQGRGIEVMEPRLRPKFRRENHRCMAGWTSTDPVLVCAAMRARPCGFPARWLDGQGGFSMLRERWAATARGDPKGIFAMTHAAVAAIPPNARARRLQRHRADDHCCSNAGALDPKRCNRAPQTRRARLADVGLAAATEPKAAGRRP